MDTLQLVRQGYSGQYTLDNKTEIYNVGRQNGNKIHLLSSHVSRHHCDIFWESADQTWNVVDIASLNGTFVNGKKLEKYQRQILSDDDILGIGITTVESEQCFIYRVGIQNRTTENVLQSPQCTSESSMSIEMTNTVIATASVTTEPPNSSIATTDEKFMNLVRPCKVILKRFSTFSNQKDTSLQPVIEESGKTFPTKLLDADTTIDNTSANTNFTEHVDMSSENDLNVIPDKVSSPTRAPVEPVIARNDSRIHTENKNSTFITGNMQNASTDDDVTITEDDDLFTYSQDGVLLSDSDDDTSPKDSSSIQPIQQEDEDPEYQDVFNYSQTDVILISDSDDDESNKATHVIDNQKLISEEIVISDDENDKDQDSSDDEWFEKLSQSQQMMSDTHSSPVDCTVKEELFKSEAPEEDVPVPLWSSTEDDEFLKVLDELDQEVISDMPPKDTVGSENEVPEEELSTSSLSLHERTELERDKDNKTVKKNEKSSSSIQGIVDGGKESESWYKASSFKKRKYDTVIPEQVKKKKVVTPVREKIKRLYANNTLPVPATAVSKSDSAKSVRPPVKVTDKSRSAFLAEELDIPPDRQKSKRRKTEKVKILNKIQTKRNSETSVTQRKSEPLQEDSSVLPSAAKISMEEMPLEQMSDKHSGGNSHIAVKRPQKSIIKNRTNVTGQKHSKQLRFNDEPMVKYFEREVDIAKCKQVRRGMKDAPGPEHIKMTANLDPVLYDICLWNFAWFKEQKTCRNPPPVEVGHTMSQAKSVYTSYDDYYEILYPLLLHELWAQVSRDVEVEENHRSDIKVHAKIVQIITDPPCRGSSQLMKLICHGIVKNSDGKKFTTGTLVVVQIRSGHDKVQPVMGYMENIKVIPKDSQLAGYLGTGMNGTDSCRELLIKCKSRESLRKSGSVRIKPLSYIRSSLRPFEALLGLKFSPLCKEILMPSFAGCNTEKTYLRDPLKINLMLNESQQEAVSSVVQTCSQHQHLRKPHMCFLQGPPGTGKTHVIVALIAHMLETYKGILPRILLCAPSNTAIDEIVLRLLNYRSTMPKNERFRVVRVGQVTQMNPLVSSVSLERLTERVVTQTIKETQTPDALDVEVSCLKAKIIGYKMKEESHRKKGETREADETKTRYTHIEQNIINMKEKQGLTGKQHRELSRASENRVLEGAQIIATTVNSCLVSSLKRFSFSSPFTFCIIDEASQCTEVETLIPLMLGVKQLVLIGDPEQLPPTVLSQVAQQKGLQSSLLKRVYENYSSSQSSPVLFLKQQYRMHKEIAQFPSQYFYLNRLQTVERTSFVCPLYPYLLLDIAGGQDEVKYNGEICNESEAHFVCSLADCISAIAAQYKLEIGIITPYQKQRQIIQTLLKQRKLECTVNTVDSFQGHEQDIIIISCVRSFSGTRCSSNSNIGFLCQPQRLNVALTRARHVLFVCGDFATLKEWIILQYGQYLKFAVRWYFL